MTLDFTITNWRGTYAGNTELAIFHYGVETGVPTAVDYIFSIISGINSDSASNLMSTHASAISYNLDTSNDPSSIQIDSLALTT
jgi:hypothetical protein